MFQEDRNTRRATDPDPGTEIAPLLRAKAAQVRSMQRLLQTPELPSAFAKEVARIKRNADPIHALNNFLNGLDNLIEISGADKDEHKTFEDLSGEAPELHEAIVTVLRDLEAFGL